MTRLLRTIREGALNLIARAAHAILKSAWFIRRPKTFGAHAIALTPEGKLILVQLRYAPGWRVPGGGRTAVEDPLEAALRELREEIGMLSFGEARLLRDFDEDVDFKRDTASIAIVRDVRYRPKRWSWEVSAIREAAPNSLPKDLAPPAARWIAAARPFL